MYGILKDEPRFKVGQLVRVVKLGDGGSEHGADVGDTDTIIAVPDETDDRYEGKHWYYNVDELAPAFLPGDKVRVTKHSGYFAVGDIGEVERQAENAVFVKHGAYQRMGLPIDADALELVAAQGASNESQPAKPEPKFKAGDVVRCLKDYAGGSFTKGKIYTVREYPTAFGSLGIVEDDQGSTTNGWNDEYFEVVAPPEAGNNGQPTMYVTEWEARLRDGLADAIGVTKRPCIVARVVDGTPRPSNIPYVHASVDAATTEAERLAKNNPGQEFAVYQRVAGRVAEVQYSMKEVA